MHGIILGDVPLAIHHKVDNVLASTTLRHGRRVTQDWLDEFVIRQFLFILCAHIVDSQRREVECEAGHWMDIGPRRSEGRFVSLGVCVPMGSLVPSFQTRVLTSSVSIHCKALELSEPTIQRSRQKQAFEE